jgi:hypothetical protein
MESEVERTESGEKILLRLSRDELALLSGSVNEAIEAVKDWEFSIRLGAHKGAARRLRSDLQDVVSRPWTRTVIRSTTRTSAADSAL